MPVLGNERVLAMLSRVCAQMLVALGSGFTALKLGNCAQRNGKSPCPQRRRQSLIIMGNCIEYALAKVILRELRSP